MEIKCSVEELKQWSKNFILAEGQEIKVADTKLKESIRKILNEGRWNEIWKKN